MFADSSGDELNMHGVFLHILGDALASVIVIITALIVWQTDDDTVAKYLDPALRFASLSIL